MTEHDLIRQTVLDYGVTAKQRMLELTEQGDGRNDNGDGRLT